MEQERLFRNFCSYLSTNIAKIDFHKVKRYNIEKNLIAKDTYGL